MSARRIHVAELAVSAITLILAGLFLWDARRYAPSPFEPIGSGAVPAGVAAAALVLAGIMTISALRGLARRSRASAESEPGGPVPANRELGAKVFASFLLTILYVAILASGLVRYGLATAIFFFLGVMIIAESPRKLLAWTIGIALLLGFGLDFAFRVIFVTNIP